MAWIESHQSLVTHRKLLRLATRMKSDKYKLIGHLHALWWWGLDNAQNDGSLGEAFPEEIAAAAGFDARRGAEFVEALVFARFLDVLEDGSYVLHNWHRYAGKLNEQRELHREKQTVRRFDMRRAYEDGTIDAIRRRDGDHCRYCGRQVDWTNRKGTTGGTYDHVVPGAPASVDNLVVACRGCNTRKSARTPSDAHMNLMPAPDIQPALDAPVKSASTLTVPTNQTVPNQPTKPDRTTPTAVAASPDIFALYEMVFGAGRMNDFVRSELVELESEHSATCLDKHFKASARIVPRPKSLSYVTSKLNHTREECDQPEAPRLAAVGATPAPSMLYGYEEP